MLMLKFKRLRLLWLILCVGLVFQWGNAAAQGAPEQIADALKAFNAELGTNLTLNDLFWSWEQLTATDTSLGCPKAGESYTTGTYVVYRFEFTYNDRIYDYRVSGDRTIVRSCGSRGINDPVGGTPAPDATPDPLSNRLCTTQTPGMIYIHTRLYAGMQAQVSAGGANRLRSEPSTKAAQVGEMPGGSAFTVVSGPVCDAEGYLWWQVSYNGATAWTAEGQGKDYFVEPKPLVLQTVAPFSVITPQNMAFLTEVGKIEGNFSGKLAYLPTGALLATGNLGGEGAWIYDSLATAPRVLPSADFLTQIAVGPSDNLALFGGEDGAIRIWDTDPKATVHERLFLNTHDQFVSAVAYKSDGTLIASAGDLALAPLPAGSLNNDPNKYAILVWDVNTITIKQTLRGHTANVTDMAFVPGTNWLASASLDGTVRVWDTDTGAQIASIDAGLPVQALAVKPDGVDIIAGLENGAIAIIKRDNLSAAPLTGIGHFGRVTDLAFSLNGQVMVSSADDGTFVMWDTTSYIVPNLATTQQDPYVRRIDGHAITGITFNPAGDMLLTLVDDRTIRVWTVSNG